MMLYKLLVIGVKHYTNMIFIQKKNQILYFG